MLLLLPVSAARVMPLGADQLGGEEYAAFTQPPYKMVGRLPADRLGATREVATLDGVTIVTPVNAVTIAASHPPAAML